MLERMKALKRGSHTVSCSCKLGSHFYSHKLGRSLQNVCCIIFQKAADRSFWALYFKSVLCKKVVEFARIHFLCENWQSS